MRNATTKKLLDAAAVLADDVDGLRFGGAVAAVYNPLRYAWAPHAHYIEKFGNSRKQLLFLGMNPGPFGMAQTGVPFGEVAFVRDWMGIHDDVTKPKREHPKRPVEGFACTRSEVSGARLWGAIAAVHKDPATFFQRAFVVNYCPLLFLGESGANITPDKLSKSERAAVETACDKHLRAVVDVLDPDVCIGVGAFAEKRFHAVAPERTIGTVLHPSPASPAANRGWAEAARKSLLALQIRDVL